MNSKKEAVAGKVVSKELPSSRGLRAKKVDNWAIGQLTIRSSWVHSLSSGSYRTDTAH